MSFTVVGQSRSMILGEQSVSLTLGLAAGHCATAAAGEICGLEVKMLGLGYDASVVIVPVVVV